MLQGNTILEFAREKRINNRIKREVVKRIEKHNDITPLYENLLNDGDFNNSILPSKLFPASRFFAGCHLTDNTNVASLAMIAGNSNITAQAGDDAYSGDNLRRGSYNTNESGIITGGIRRVWDWSTSQGNGTIASVCLTTAQLGKADFSKTYVPADADVAFERLSEERGFLVDESTIGNCSIIDIERNRAYGVTYDNGTITVKEFEINGTERSLLVPNAAGYLLASHTISQSVLNYSKTTASVSYTGDYIHLLTFSSESNILNDYAIKLSDWSCSYTQHTYSGVSFTALTTANTMKNLYKDAMPIIDSYVYAISDSGSKIVKCSLTDDIVVAEYSNPLHTVSGRDGNGASVILPNGDFYKFDNPNNQAPVINSCLYFHNGEFYIAKNISFSSRYNCAQSMNSNDYGSIIGLGLSTYSEYDSAYIDLAFPYVSTVNNLDEAVKKAADLTMKLTYEITVA